MLLLLLAALILTSLSMGAGLPGDSAVTDGPAPEVPPPPPLPPSALNLTFEPGTWTLTWPCSRDITVTSCSATVTAQGRPRRQRKQVGGASGDVILSQGGGASLPCLGPGGGGTSGDVVFRQNPLGCRCRFRPLTLHLGVTLEVNATTAGNITISDRLDYALPGPPGSEAVNVSCEIHEAAAMTCTWGAGPAAPPDARYFLVLRDAMGHELPGCPDGPTPSGCRVDDLTGFPRLLHVTVAGSSRSGALRAYDIILNTKAIERLSPPRDVTGRCNASHCAVSWAPPRTWAAMGFADFRYELELRRADTNAEDTVTVSSRPENLFTFPSPEPRAGHVVRVRVGDVRSERWSAWSPRVEFGAASPAVPRMPVYLTAVAATLICALGLTLTWRRFAGHRLLPRIPEIRDKVSDNALVNPQTLRRDLLLPADKTV